MIRTTLILFVALTLSACSAFQIGERYDKSIDDDLNAFQTKTTAFIASMVQGAGTPAGGYAAPEAKSYYADAAASLSNIMLRASLLSNRVCPIGGRIAAVSTPIAPEPATTAGASSVTVSGNCVVVTLRAVQSAFETLQINHRERGHISAFDASISTRAIDNSVFIALSGLRAKDY